MKILIAALILSPSIAFAQSFDFSCYTAAVSNKDSDVKKVFFGWSENWDWSSFIAYQVSASKNYSSDIDCSPKPEKGSCTIHDDGAQLEITAYSKKLDKLKIKFPGSPVLEKTDGEGNFRPSVLKESAPVTLIFKRTNKTLCKY